MTLKQTYIDYLIVVLPAILAIALAIVMIRLPVIGRKWTLVFSSMFMGISLFLYSIVNTQASRVGFNLMEYFFQSLFNAVVNNPIFVILFLSVSHFNSSLDGHPKHSPRLCEVPRRVSLRFGAIY